MSKNNFTNENEFDFRDYPDPENPDSEYIWILSWCYARSSM